MTITPDDIADYLKMGCPDVLPQKGCSRWESELLLSQYDLRVGKKKVAKKLRREILRRMKRNGRLR